MSNHITFKEYFALSKKQLLEAMDNVPCVEHEFNINRYCKMPVTDNDVLTVSLKPKEKIYVTMLYENMEEPTVLSIRFNAKGIDINNKYHSTWKNTKIINWLEQNSVRIK